jgi:hypothetical protein
VTPILLPKQRKMPERIKRRIALRELATLQATDKPRHRMRPKNPWLREPLSQSERGCVPTI